MTINLIRGEAAHQLDDRSQEALALAYHAEIRSKQGNMAEAEKYLMRLEEVVRDVHLPDEVTFEVQHARGLFARAHGDLAHAEQIWRDLLHLSAQLGGQKYVVNRRWLATCLAQQGRLAEAQPLYEESLRDAIEIRDQRSITGNKTKLAGIALEQGETEQAATLLAECLDIATQYHDRRRIGEIQRLLAHIQAMQGNMAGAQASLISAVELFERMGMRREMEDALAALQQLRMHEFVSH